MRYDGLDPDFCGPGNGDHLAGPAKSALPSDIQAVALRKLRLLNQARILQDLRVPPGNRLEVLHAERAGQHSIRINDQWRICFVWTEGGPEHVEIVDYHD
jgi:proteic killer suppression protein